LTVIAAEKYDESADGPQQEGKMRL
jgi:hypothetical protein